METKINELCRAASITTAYQLQIKAQLSPSQAARLYKDEVEAISLSVLEKLCNTLECSPDDIFGYAAVASSPVTKGKLKSKKTGEGKEFRKPETGELLMSVGNTDINNIKAKKGKTVRELRDSEGNVLMRIGRTVSEK